MARRLILHIGSMKSGTSFVQNVLLTNKELLADQGVLFAGHRWRDQVRAVLDLIAHGGARQEPMAADGPWRVLADEINAWAETAVVSMEFLAPRQRGKIHTILESFPDTDIQVVLTGRDLTRNIPAMWLESVQNGSSLTWDEFLDAVRAQPVTDPAGQKFWKQQGLATIARRWTRSIGRHGFTLVTVPQRGAPHDLLWRRFARVVGLELDEVDLDVRANPGIGLATALTLRRLNEVLVEDGKPPPYYDSYVKHLLAKRGLVSRQRQEPRLGLDAPWALERGRREVDALAALGLDVVGDLEELQPRPVPGVHPDEVPMEDQMAAAVAGLAHLLETGAERDRRHRRELRFVRRQTGAAG